MFFFFFPLLPPGVQVLGVFAQVHNFQKCRALCCCYSSSFGTAVTVAVAVVVAAVVVVVVAAALIARTMLFV